MAELYKSMLENDVKFDKISKIAFDNVNNDKSGAINKEQLEKLMNQISTDLGYDIPLANEVDEVFDYLDKDKKGFLSYDDFKVLMKDIFKAIIQQLS